MFRSTNPLRGEPVNTKKASDVEIVMYWHHHGWAGEIETSGYLERSVFQNESHTAIWDRSIFGRKANKVG